MKGRNESSIPGSPATTVSHLHFHSYRDEGVTPTILSFFVLAHRLTVKEEINLWNHERAQRKGLVRMSHTLEDKKEAVNGDSFSARGKVLVLWRLPAADTFPSFKEETFNRSSRKKMNVWMLRLFRSLSRFETQDIKTQPQFNHYLIPSSSSGAETMS